MIFLDLLVRGIVIPGIWIFIFTQIPEFREMLQILINFFKRKGKVSKKRKITQTYTGPTVIYSSNSLKY